MKFIIRIILWTILIIILAFLWIKIIVPSYHSFKLVCDEEYQENHPNIVVVGEFYMGNISIEEGQTNREYVKTMKHEMCHYYIYLLNKSSTCDEPIRYFLEEARCSFSEYV